MPPKPPSPGLAKVTFVQLWNGRTFGDSLYFAHTDGSTWTVAQLNSLAEGAGDSYDVGIIPMQNSGLTHVSTDTVDLSDMAGRVGTHVSGLAGGSTGTHPLTMNTVAHIALEVARRYRGGRPGYNVSGLDMTDLTDARTLSSATVTALASAISALIANTTAFGGLGAPVINVGVSYFLDKLLRPTPLQQPITEYEPQQRVCSLRRRSGKPITE